ncbi:MAG: hypothetical protein K6G80_05335 [Treponema sp.]|nr:hypothetical protein [Treponema sp.]
MFLTGSTLFAQQALSSEYVLAKSDIPVSSVAWSPDGKSFATVWNNSVVLWNAENNEIQAVYQEHSGPVKVVHYNQDGSRLLSLGLDNMIVMRDVSGKAGDTRVVGSGFAPMNDAVFAGDKTSVILPRDGVASSLYYPLRLTNQFVSHLLLETKSPVQSFDMTKDGSLLLVASQDGKVFLVQMQTRSVVSEYERFASSGIAPRFSPDGRFILAATDSNTLVLTPVGTQDVITVKDSDSFANCAAFNSDGTRIAVALKNGGLKVFNVLTGTVQVWFTLPSVPDEVTSLCFSPDGKHLLAGTAAGNILRWSLLERDFVPVKRQNPQDFVTGSAELSPESVIRLDGVSPDNSSEGAAGSGEGKASGGGEADSEKRSRKQPAGDALSSGIEISALCTSLNEEYYHTSFGLCGAWRTYALFPLYWGAGAECAVSVPSDDYPYEYYFNGETLNNPWLYRMSAFSCAGLGYYLPDTKLLFFAEARLGAGGKVLFNNELTYSRTSKLALSVLGDMLMGVQWKNLRVSFGGEYDQNLGLIAKAAVGGVIPLKKK